VKENISWNQQLPTDRNIQNDKTDNKIRENKKETCMIIDVKILGDSDI
jgi:hypothetical protein